MKKERGYAPKFRFKRVWRRGIAGNTLGGKVQYRVVSESKDHLAFRLAFNPPLSCGELVHYGFYAWTRHHFATARSEALQRRDDEWTEEGIAVVEPTLETSIVVHFPPGYHPRSSRVIRYLVTTPEGPTYAAPITSDYKFIDEGNALSLSLKNPRTGNYFVCWIPPERNPGRTCCSY